MSEVDRDLLKLAESVTDGEPVDWEGELRTEDEATRSRVRRLRIVESIARASGMPRDAGHSAPAVTWGSLQLQEKLCDGTSAELYRAWEPGLAREVALKLQHPSAGGDSEKQRRFLEEARRLARVRHPNVLAVHGVEERDGRVGLWTDLVRGKTLEECLAEQGPFGAREAALVGVDLCRALAAVHGAGLVHRDVKTANVMREEGGRIVLMDFGTVVERAEPAAPGAEPLGGSPLYMAPELLREGRATPSSDVYALGVLLFRLAAGTYPFVARSLDELVDKQAHGDALRLRDLRPDLPAPFVRSVERALAARPEDRYASVAELEADLAVTLGDAPAPERSGTDASPLHSWIGRRTLAAGALLLASLVASFVVAPRLVRFEADAALFREAASGEERLRAGSRVQPGDRLFLELRLSRPAHVYVLNEDARGHAFVLFPVAGLAPENPLAPRMRHRLPGPVGGAPGAWEIDSAGGHETILVVASRASLPEVEAVLRDFRQPVVDPGPAATGEDSGSGLRGLGKIVATSPRTAAPVDSRVGQLVRELARQRGAARGIWMQEIQLENPTPE